MAEETTYPTFDSIEEAGTPIGSEAAPATPAEESKTPATESVEVPAEISGEETPKETPSETTPAKTEAPAFEMTDEIRINAINEQFGTSYKTIEEVQAAKAEFSELPTYKEYKTKFEEASSKPQVKFHSDKIKELNNFAAATNIDDINVYHALKLYQNASDKDSIEAMVLAEIINDPSQIDKKDIIRELIQDEFNLTIDPEAEDQQAEQRRVEKEKMKIELKAKGAKKLIDETLGKVSSYTESLPKDTTVENQQKRAADQSAWKETLSDNKFKDLFKTVEVQVPLGKTEDGVDLGSETINLPLSDEQHKKLLSNIESAVASGLGYSQESIDQMINVQRTIAIAQNISAIAAKASEVAVAKAKLAWLKETHNPSGVKVETPSKTNTELTPEKQLEDAIINA